MDKGVELDFNGRWSAVSGRGASGRGRTVAGVEDVAGGAGADQVGPRRRPAAGPLGPSLGRRTIAMALAKALGRGRPRGPPAGPLRRRRFPTRRPRRRRPARPQFALRPTGSLLTAFYCVLLSEKMIGFTSLRLVIRSIPKVVFFRQGGFQSNDSESGTNQKKTFLFGLEIIESVKYVLHSEVYTP